MKRRKFIRSTSLTMASVLITNRNGLSGLSEQSYVRLGGPVFEKYTEPEEWIHALKVLNYRAAYCPLEPGESDSLVKAYREAAQKNDIVISEVGAWGNLISPDSSIAKEAMDKCIRSLDLADKIGANCCVNISGSRNEEYWAGPHPDNLKDGTFDLIVEITRKIIDSVKPSRTFFTLEPMPWAFPYSPDSYRNLVTAIDRPQFGVHLDPVNMIISPQTFFRNAKLIKECFSKLGQYIRSCHAKDIVLREDIYTPHLSEIRAGLGHLDYRVFLTELSKLKDIPMMIEHLETAEEYRQAAEYIRSVGKEVNVRV